jgi:hypothetical protein
MRRRPPGPHFAAWVAARTWQEHEAAADELLWWLSFQSWREMPPEVAELVWVRLSFAWTLLVEGLAAGMPAPVRLEQRVGVIHGLVFREWAAQGLEFLEAYGRTGARDELGNSLN